MRDRERRGKVNGNRNTQQQGHGMPCPKNKSINGLGMPSPYIPAYFSPHRNWYEALIIALLVSLLSIISRGKP